MTTMDRTVVHARSSQSSGHERVGIGRGGASGAHHGLVTAVPRSQLYYWSTEWQRLEREALRELETGQARRFATASDAIRWLLSDDD